MPGKSHNSTSNKGSFAYIYKMLHHEIRNNIVAELNSEDMLSFNVISERLRVDRAALAYHLRLLKQVGLIENFYHKREGSKNHSYYRLTSFARWLLSRDMNLSLESEHFQIPLEADVKPGDLSVNPKSSRIRISGEESPEIPEKEIDKEKVGEVTTGLENNVKIIIDPRIKYRSYRVILE